MTEESGKGSELRRGIVREMEGIRKILRVEKIEGREKEIVKKKQ